MDVSVAIVQPLVPHYRVPVFESLAQHPGLKLTVIADLAPTGGSLQVVDHSDAFELRHSARQRLGPFIRQGGMVAVARDPHFDVVVFEWSSRLYQLPAAMKKARRAGKGVALWGHGYGTTVPWLGDIVRNRLISLADACVLYGFSARDTLAGKGYPADKLFVAPNAIDQSPIQEAVRFWRTRGRLDRFRREHQIARVPLLAYISRLEPEKRPEMLIEALAKVRAVRPDAIAVFIGSGSAQRHLEQRANELNLSEAVRFLGPLHDEMAIAPWALSSVCLVQPEKLGLSILHAFGYGLPAITSEDSSLHLPEVEVLEHGVNGLFYRHRDVNDLTNKILTLIEDTNLRNNLSARAVRAVNSRDGRGLPVMVSGLAAAIVAAAEQAAGRKSEV
jgi:glycosyltransferase involved in cell wall biosynthesis